MLRTGKCQKCASKDLVTIPGNVGAYGIGNNIQVGWTFWTAVKVTRLLCADCGFSEEWVEAPEDRKSLRDKFRGK